MQKLADICQRSEDSDNVIEKSLSSLQTLKISIIDLVYKECLFYFIESYKILSHTGIKQSFKLAIVIDLVCYSNTPAPLFRTKIARTTEFPRSMLIASRRLPLG